MRSAVAAEPSLRRSLGLARRPGTEELRRSTLEQLASVVRWLTECGDTELEPIVASRPTNRPAQAGRLRDLILLDSVSAGSRLRWRCDGTATWRRVYEAVVLTVGDTKVALPTEIEQALVQLEAGESIGVGELAPSMRPDVVVLLAQQLLRHGAVAPE